MRECTMVNKKGLGNYMSREEWREKLPELDDKDLKRAQIEISNDIATWQRENRFKPTSPGKPHAKIGREEVERKTLLEDHYKDLIDEIEKRRE